MNRRDAIKATAAALACGAFGMLPKAVTPPVSRMVPSAGLSRRYERLFLAWSDGPFDAIVAPGVPRLLSPDDSKGASPGYACLDLRAEPYHPQTGFQTWLVTASYGPIESVRLNA